jgi:ribokinase
MVAIPRILVLGSANLDTVVSVPHLPVPGETVLAQGWTQGLGGKGANQAVAAARCGAQVTLAGAVGQDPDGVLLLDSLRGSGVDVSRVRTSGALGSGRAMVLVDEAGENLISVYAGANALASVRGLDAEELAANFDLALSQLEVPASAVEELGQLCEAAGVPFMLNLAPYSDVPRSVLSRCRVLVVNREEARGLTGVVVRTKDDAIVAARAARVLGAQHVVVTLGADGCVAVDDDRELRVDGLRVRSVDTTGSGDAFVGSLATSLAQGASLDDAVRDANVWGAAASATPGAVTTDETVRIAREIGAISVAGE